MSLRRRIGAAAGLAVAIAVLAAAAIVYVAVRAQLRDGVDSDLRSLAREVVSREPGHGPGGRGAPDGGRPPPGRLLLPLPGRTRFGGAEAYAQFLTADGLVVRPPAAPAALPVPSRARDVAAGRSPSYAGDMTVGGTHVRVLTQAVPGGAVQLARPLGEVDRTLRRLLVVLLVVAAAGVGLAVALGTLVARTALAPVARFTRRTETIAADGDMTQRIEVEGDDELARLATSFNSTLDALQRSVEAQRQLVADAGHELRTPLASLRANIQVLEQADQLTDADHAALRADVVRELDELTALVGDVVELARGSGADEELDDVRVDRIAAALVERFRRRAAGRVEFTLDAEPTVVAGMPGRIHRAVANLLDNALKWSPDGARVEVTLREGVLAVRDRGPGFAERDVPHVFERFYRADSARGLPGSGLGLAIVRQAAEAHGGSAEAANAPGGGALLRVSFGAWQRVGNPPVVARDARPTG
jgi:two-component system sensor histidine kinase MprB